MLCISFFRKRKVTILFHKEAMFLCSFVLTQKNQKVKKETIYSTFLSFALIELFELSFLQQLNFDAYN
jgi:hypothetical protein